MVPCCQSPGTRSSENDLENMQCRVRLKYALGRFSTIGVIPLGRHALCSSSSLISLPMPVVVYHGNQFVNCLKSAIYYLN